MKKKKSVRVRGVRGYGPRHMMNAQEGSEAVPGDLPSPPDYSKPPGYAQPVLDEFRNMVLPPEAMAAIRADPTSAASLKALAKAALAGGAMLSGGEEEPALGPAPNAKNLPDWAREELLRRGQNPARPFNDFDIANPSIKAAIEADPTLTQAQKSSLLKTGDYPQPERDAKGKTKVGVAKGFGPGHAENSKEGDDLTQVNTDTVPAMLTPREAVLNRNAAELAGRGTIEKLNSEGNKLARKGVDLAAGGMADVKEKIMKSKPKSSKPAASGSPYVQAFQNLMPKGGAPVGYQGGGGNVGGTDPMMPGMGGGLGARDQYGRQFSNRDASGSYGQGNGVPGAGVIGVPGGPYGTRNDTGPGVIGGPMGGGPFPGRGPGGVYPGAMPGMQGPGTPPTQQGPFQGRAPNGMYYQPQAQGLADGSSNVGPIGTPPQGEQAYGPPVNLTAPQIQQLAKQTGISPTQIMGLMKAFQGGKDIYNSVGSGGYDTASPATSQAVGDAFGFGAEGMQGGISDIGYPPFVAPSANYDGNRGGWLGPYDPSFMIQRYAGGTSYVSPFR